MNQFSVRIDLEDHSAGLFGTIVSNEFSGSGKGWFNIIDIRHFVSKAREMLNTLEGKANLVAGQNSQDGSEYIERFGLRCYPIGKIGTIGVHVTLADYPYTDCRLEEIFKVSGEIKTEIQLFDEFLNQLLNLISKQVDVAILQGLE